MRLTLTIGLAIFGTAWTACNSSKSSTAPKVEIDDFSKRWAQTLCSHRVNCCEMDEADQASCEIDESKKNSALYEEAYTFYDSQQAGTCIQEYEASTCETFGNFYHQACDQTSRGILTLGANCEGDFQCENRACVAVEEKNQCVESKVVTAGELCGDMDVVPTICEVGFVCDISLNLPKCVAYCDYDVNCDKPKSEYCTF
jgi:hypothetical protein